MMRDKSRKFDDDDSSRATRSEHPPDKKKLRWGGGVVGAWARTPARRLAAGAAAVLLAVLAMLACLSRDGVPIDHLDAARAYFDRRDVLYSRWAEAGLPEGLSTLVSGTSGEVPAVPTYTAEQKRALGAWDNDAALRHCEAVKDTPLVWTLKTPKAASSTLQDLILGVSPHSLIP